MIVSFLNQKGGVGKTTLTLNIAHWFKKQGSSVAVIDTDKQGSARDWHEHSNGEILDVFGLDRPTLDVDLKRLDLKRDWIFIDGVPQVSIMAAKAIAISDVVMIPVQPSPYDVWASKEIVDLIKRSQTVGRGNPKAAFIISRKIINTNIGKDVINALQQYEMPVFANGTTQRVIYAKAGLNGGTVIGWDSNEAADEIEKICTELMEFTNDRKQQIGLVSA